MEWSCILVEIQTCLSISSQNTLMPNKKSSLCWCRRLTKWGLNYLLLDEPPESDSMYKDVRDGIFFLSFFSPGAGGKSQKGANTREWIKGWLYWHLTDGQRSWANPTGSSWLGNSWQCCHSGSWFWNSTCQRHSWEQAQPPATPIGGQGRKYSPFPALQQFGTLSQSYFQIQSLSAHRSVRGEKSIPYHFHQWLDLYWCH